MLNNLTFEQACETCRLAGFCFPTQLTDKEIKQFDNMVKRRKIYHKNEYIYKEGEPFTDVYIIRSGSVKTVSRGVTAEERVTGFWFPGEVLGLGGIHRNIYVATATALDTTSVCELKFTDLKKLSQQIPVLADKLINLMSERIAELYQPKITNSAERSLALFLLNVSARLAQTGISTKELKLTMARKDIANYLDLATETVSRVFTKFHKENIITTRNKLIELKDIKQLQQIACNLTYSLNPS